MSRNEYDTETVSKHGLEFKAIWEIDESPDTSWLGEWLAKPPSHGHYVDRNTGTLYSGSMATEAMYFDTCDTDELDAEIDTEDGETVAIKINTEEQAEWLKRASDAGYYASLSENHKVVLVSCDLPEILATGLWVEPRFGSRDAAYFGKTQHLPYNAKQWSKIDTNHDALDADEEARIKKLGIEITNREGRPADEIRSILYACEDSYRMEEYCADRWCFLDLHVELEFEGETFESSYCGGYESDMSAKDKLEIINEHIDEIMQELPEAIDKKIAALNELKAKINENTR